MHKNLKQDSLGPGAVDPYHKRREELVEMKRPALATLVDWALADRKVLSFNFRFFASGGGYPLYPEIFTVLHNDPAAPQKHCGRCQIRTRDFCPRSLARYQVSHHISNFKCITHIY